MDNLQIVFVDKEKAELQNSRIGDPAPDEVLVKTEYTVISGGTERACLMALENTSQEFPQHLGYCGVGIVQEVGAEVTDILPGDRVLVYHGTHALYNIRPQADITVVKDDSIPSEEAAFVIIASMGLGGVRKLELEIGESAMVMGQGLLGIFATQFCRLNGANPVIAADPNKKRRTLALDLGADYALDPSDPDFVRRVREICGGVNATVEVTGSSLAMKQALECAAPLGRISLLGCTRVSDCSIDYYNLVHKPGVRLIGAHNFVRPKVESYPHHWTHQDDCKAILDLLSAKRIKIAPVISRIVSPLDAALIYKQLCEDPDFPMGTVFDWKSLW